MYLLWIELMHLLYGADCSVAILCLAKKPDGLWKECSAYLFPNLFLEILFLTNC